jgi:CRISPR/Cas system-associated exonuclease Cas4 (RecB family)|tara:strand:+ start:4494 stop:5249 length:756 start_codon:yes stop_codon:yes gene_type:complete
MYKSEDWIDIEKIYHEYLERKREVNKVKYEDFKGWFNASSAGSCYRKMIYRARDYEVDPIEHRTNRLLRLGTIVHSDIEKSIKAWLGSPKYELVTEYQIQLPQFLVVGHLDIGVIDKKNDRIKVYDIKTCGSWKWRMKFGRKRDTNPSVNYELQIGTYGIGLGKDSGTTDVSLSILWYNKDTSAIREEPIADEWMEEAYEYWTELREVSDNTKHPEELIPGSPNVPLWNWECKYCEYKDKYCPGVSMPTKR